ncbi:MAG TPA: Spy/CpxP family protein refolding chaperone [Xanthobacteraceae bacterium]|jgi:hypothetical protein|nr:Spy/CpxP family protein refolding chaperone [Xanthobacteraceae bacterium]
MRMSQKISAAIALGALAATLGASSPAAAFGLRIGPFHIGIPTPWYHHRHPLYARANPDDMSRSESQSAQNVPSNASLFYPNDAVPAIFQNIFWPAYSSAWPFGYQAIFATAFAKAAPDKGGLCQPTANAQDMIGRLAQELSPTPEQMPLVQKLGGAMGAASATLAKSCPDTIPAQPVARLQLMQGQLQQLAVAIDMIRQPLIDLAQTLTDDQRAKFDAIPAAIADRKQTDMALASCAGTATAIDWSVDRIDRSVQPTDTQRTDINTLRDAFSQAANDLQAHCPTSMPATPFGRLEAIEARLDATWRSVLSIQVALSNFETKLSAEQKDRFETINFASR